MQLEVSILVLLDVALKAGMNGWVLAKFWSFNPCSLGCRFESIITQYCVLAGEVVSILVLLDVALKAPFSRPVKSP